MKTILALQYFSHTPGSWPAAILLLTVKTEMRASNSNCLRILIIILGDAKRSNARASATSPFKTKEASYFESTAFPGLRRLETNQFQTTGSSDGHLLNSG